VRFRAQNGKSESVQRGFALIALLALAALISAFLIASTLNLTSAGDSNERAQRTIDALTKAKAALIAHAATEQWQLYKALPNTPATDPNTYFQPGALPCPDNNNDGDANCVGLGIGPNSSLIGRLPWKTMGIDDLRDSSGERLWYALSHHFRKMQCSSLNVPAGCTTINSDTQPCDTPACLAGGRHLTVNGSPASDVVAIVFAPGAALDLRAIAGPLQDRSAGPNDPANYLENFDLGDGTHFTFTTALPTNTFNDRLLVITQADLMAAVEPVVAAKIEGDVKALLQDYFGRWGNRYPFAAAFDISGAGPGREPQVVPNSSDRALSTYTGVSGQTTGLLPLATALNFTWSNATVTQIPGGTGISTVTSSSCSIGGSPLKVTCTVNYTGDGPTVGAEDRPDIKLELFLANANMAFADIPSPTTATEDLVMKNGDGNNPPVQNDPPFGWWSLSNFGAPVLTPTLTFVAKANGGALTYIGRLQNAAQMKNQATISFPLPTPPGYLPRLTNTNPANPNILWFLRNQWYRQTYYAVSPGFAPGGTGACSPPPATLPALPCLRVNDISAPTNNKQAILMFAGRALDGSIRPSGNLANYLEFENSTPADFIYQHRAGTPTGINDRVVILSP